MVDANKLARGVAWNSSDRSALDCFGEKRCSGRGLEIVPGRCDANKLARGVAWNSAFGS